MASAEQPSEEALIRVAQAILRDLEDRRGIKQQLQAVRWEDPGIYREIQLAIGRLAWDAVMAERTAP
jgi:hypothetical protein